MLIQQLESKIKDIPVSFKKEQMIQLDEQKHNNFAYPNKIIKLTDIQETLKRIKRSSMTPQKKDLQTPIDLCDNVYCVSNVSFTLIISIETY